MEVDFLLKNFTPKVSQDFDDAMESIVTGSKPYCYRTLAFTVKRLHNEDSAAAWASLNNRHKPISIPPPPPLEWPQPPSPGSLW